jgi:hypothetical protein
MDVYKKIGKTALFQYMWLEELRNTTKRLTRVSQVARPGFKPVTSGTWCRITT